MKFTSEFQILVALLCVYLIHQIDGVPQAGYGRPQQRHNATAWNNNWRQNATQQRPNWQRENQTIANSHSSYPNNVNNNRQPQGERLWLNNNQSHPNIQVPGFRSNPTNSGWLAPGNLTSYTNWKGGVSNSAISGNSGSPAQVRNGTNSYPNWHAGLPGSALVAGTNNGTSLPSATSSRQQNTSNAGWNVPSGHPNGAYSTHPYGKLFA